MAKICTSVLVCAIALGLASCGYSQDGADQGENRTASFSEEGDRAVLQTYRSAEALDSNPPLDSYFRDSMDFTVDDLRSGATNCRDIIDDEDIADRLHPWPTELKAFLIAELKAFPALPLVPLSLHGLYLVDSDVMTNPDTGTAAGIACDRGQDLKGLVFLNYDTFVKDRKKGAGRWQNLRVVTNKFLLQEAGDNAAVTLIHEIIHTIDNKIFVHGNDSLRRLRSQVFDMSWKSYTEPKAARRIGIYALADEAASEGTSIEALQAGLRSRGNGCHRSLPQIQPTAIETAAQSAQATVTSGGDPAADRLADDLRYLAERTNFIVPYSMASAAEDFAESLTVYHFGINRDSWQIRTVFDRDVRTSRPSEARALFKHDTSVILDTMNGQKDKMCALAELLFGSCVL